MRSMPFWLRAATWARCAKTSSAVNLLLLGPAKQENAKHRSSRFLASKDALRAVWIVSNAICVVCHHTSFSNAATAAACGLPGLFFMTRCAAASAPSSVRMKSMAGCRVSCGPKRGARVKGRQTLYMACDQHLQLSHAKKLVELNSFCHSYRNMRPSSRLPTLSRPSTSCSGKRFPQEPSSRPGSLVLGCARRPLQVPPAFPLGATYSKSAALSSAMIQSTERRSIAVGLPRIQFQDGCFSWASTRLAATK